MLVSLIMQANDGFGVNEGPQNRSGSSLNKEHDAVGVIAFGDGVCRMKTVFERWMAIRLFLDCQVWAVG